jgi:glycosyltransferase involved in cell wall biosynthesis
MTRPLFSLVMCVKNGMPYVVRALESVAAQTFRDFELVVQDGASTDGTVEVLRRVEGIPEVRVESAPDSGLGEAYNRVLARCAGELVGTLDSDNLLEPDALERMAAVFRKDPHAAAIYASAILVDAQERPKAVFIPDDYDLLRMLRSELVPPLGAAFFSRRACGEALRFDARMTVSQDFDLWLRLGHLPIRRVPGVVVSVRQSGRNLSSTPENYYLFCREKIEALDHHLARSADPLPRALARQLHAGVYCWAAESVFSLEGASERVRRYLGEATRLDPGYGRAHALAARLREAERDGRPDGAPRRVGAGAPPAGATPISPAMAYWNQRHALAATSGRLRSLREALDDTRSFSSFQWAQWFAYARDYRPDLVLELGRYQGSSTAALAEALRQNEHGRLVSVCPTNAWNELALARLRSLVDRAWLARLDVRTGEVVDTDFDEVLGDARRVLVVWRAPGFATAGAVLGCLMPRLQDRSHVVIMHDVSDLRHCGSALAYDEAGSFRGSGSEPVTPGSPHPRLCLGWVTTAAEHPVAVMDFLQRNRSELQSADRSFHLEIGADARKRTELSSLLSPEDFSLLAHWAYFSLNGAPRPYTFPKCRIRRS